MEKKIPLLPLLLTWAGAIPFVLAPILLYVPNIESAWVARFIEVYAIIILSFLGGIDWGLATTQQQATRGVSTLMVWSIAPPVLGWLIYIFNINMLLEYLVIIYILQWFVNYQSYRKLLCPYWYLKLRSIITPTVVILMLITAFLLYYNFR